MPERHQRPRLKGPNEKEPDYEVGYGKPPAETQFRKGQSGNPGGRPKGARNRTNSVPALNEERMKTVVLEEAYRLVGMREGDRLVEIPVVQAVIRSIAANAAKGNHRSQQLFGELVQWVERENKQLHDEWLETAIEYKRDWEKALKGENCFDAANSDPLPHPDDIVIDMKAGQVKIRGPMTREEQVEWERAREHLQEHREFVGQLEEMLDKQTQNKALRKILDRQRKVYARLEEAFGPYTARKQEEERRRKESNADIDQAADQAADRCVVNLQDRK